MIAPASTKSGIAMSGNLVVPANNTSAMLGIASKPDVNITATTDTARETQEFAYATAERMDPELLEDLRNAGIVINEPDQDAFVTASSAVYDEFAASVANGGELIDRVLALATR